MSFAVLSVSPNYECRVQICFAVLSVSPNYISSCSIPGYRHVVHRAALPLTRQLGLCVGLRLREGYTAQADGSNPQQCGHVAFCAVAEATLITTLIEMTLNMCCDPGSICNKVG